MTTKTTSKTVARINALRAAYVVAHDVSHAAERASLKVLAPLFADPAATEETFAAARVAAGLPTAAEEAALWRAMDVARTDYVRALRRVAKALGITIHDASDAFVAEHFAR